MLRKTDRGKDIPQNADELIKKHGYTDYKWVDPGKIVVAQWVRTKCMFGCPEYGNAACCPPNVPGVEECERFFFEYSQAVIFHFEQKVKKPEDRHKWTKKVNTGLSRLEREIFLAGYERTFLLFMDSCGLCKECSGKRERCKVPHQARPSPEAMAVDVFSTVRQFGFSIEVLGDYSAAMNRFAFMMVK